MFRARHVLLVVALAAGCGGRHVAPPPSEDPREAVLFYTVPGGRAASPVPLVRGSVGGHRTLMIIDTGAAIPVVAGWLAKEVGLELGAPMRAANDIGGHDVPMRVSLHPSIFIDGWGAVPDRAVGVIDLPPGFEVSGVGAIISPQALADEHDAVLLDLATDKMRRTPAARALAPAASSPERFAMPGARICAYGWGGMEGRAMVANAVVDGAPVTIELDTGTNATMVVSESDIGRTLATRPGVVKRNGIGAAGAFGVVTASDVELQLGDFRKVTEVSVNGGAKDARCGQDGRVGTDVLRACVLVIGRRDLQVSCARR